MSAYVHQLSLLRVSGVAPTVWQLHSVEHPWAAALMTRYRMFLSASTTQLPARPSQLTTGDSVAAMEFLSSTVRTWDVASILMLSRVSSATTR